MEIDKRGHRRALRDARRRDPQRRADDLHRRQRHPDRQGSGGHRAVRARSCRCSRRCASCSRSCNKRRRAARLDRLRPQGAGDRPRRRRAWSRRSSPPSATSPTGSSRSSCSSPTRRWRSISTSATMPTLYRVHEEPDPVKVAQFEEFISTLGYSLSRSAEDGQAARFPEAGRADARHARGEADRVPHAAHHAEGALRPVEPGALRPGGVELHALHVADPPLSGPDRASHAARVAARPDDRGPRGPS